MEHSEPASVATHRTVEDLSAKPQPLMKAHKHAWLHPKVLILGVVCLSLAAILLAALRREATSTRQPVTASRMLQPTRPALTPAEEEYIGAVWPIHGEVERSTAIMSLGEIFYLNNDPDMSKEKFKKRVDAALATYQQAEQQLRALQPPASLKKKHDKYLAAVLLLKDSTLERLKLFKDGKREHLQAAYPPLQQATDKIRVLGAEYWPDEFVPH
jgi:hypothetical protein